MHLIAIFFLHYLELNLNSAFFPDTNLAVFIICLAIISVSSVLDFHILGRGGLCAAAAARAPKASFNLCSLHISPCNWD